MYYAHWGGFNDPQSGILSYKWGIGTIPGVDNIMPFASVGQRTDASISGVTLRDGMAVYVTIIVCNHAFLCVQQSSDGVIVDGSPPVVVRVAFPFCLFYFHGIPESSCSNGFPMHPVFK